MNIKNALLKEHSKSQTLKIIQWVGADEKRFAELVELFLYGDSVVIQRASWPISYCAIEHPELMKPYFGKFIALLDQPNLHPAVKRNVMRLLQFIPVPKKHIGRLTNSSFKLLMNISTPIAIRAFAMTVLLNITKQEPELKRELKIVIEEAMKEGSGGIIARGKKVLSDLAKIN